MMYVYSENGEFAMIAHQTSQTMIFLFLQNAETDKLNIYFLISVEF